MIILCRARENKGHDLCKSQGYCGSWKRYAMSLEHWIHIIRINVNKSLKIIFLNISAWKTSGAKMIPEI